MASEIPRQQDAVRPLKAPVPRLSVQMDDEEASLTMGLGLLVRHAGAVEYVLHSLVVHLADAPRAYEYKPADPAAKYIKECEAGLDAMSGEAPIPTAARHDLAQNLVSLKGMFHQRNGFVHGRWVFDDESDSWLTIKGVRGSRRPEITFVGPAAIWELASEFQRIESELIDWDARHFGQPGDPEDGQPVRISVKSI
ncbi:hypothetical protein [Streptomyces qinglanensis]|uniref:hypothetical protein n=1 Tax=Streptomyces qinglanensis TaxID=943816 RepID=UPI003D732959